MRRIHKHFGPKSPCAIACGRTLLLALLLTAASVTRAQTTAFTYQGRLTDGGTPANGPYDLQFTLFDSGGTQIGSPLTHSGVAVSAGIFTVQLDFGAGAFPGADRFLEIGARPAGGGTFTILSPRQPITPTPYALRSLNASSADNVSVNGVRAFSVTGGVFANSNTFVGVGAGASNMPSNDPSKDLDGNLNTFVGRNAGNANTTGTENSFFGEGAGRNNTTGGVNTFVGFRAGLNNLNGGGNIFVGPFSGAGNTTGRSNTFLGGSSGLSNTIENRNTLIGDSADGAAGISNATAVGANAKVTASNSLVLGSIAGVNGATNSVNVGIGTTSPAANLTVASPAATFDLFNTTANAGYRQQVDNSASGPEWIMSNTSIGSIMGIHAAGNIQLLYPLGLGTGFPTAKLTVAGAGAFNAAGAARFDLFNSTANAGYLQHVLDDGRWQLATTTGATRMLIDTAGNVGIGTTAPDQLLSVNGNASKVGGGSWATFSDERLKDIRGRFTTGLKAVLQLQPLRYQYKRDNALALKSAGEHIGFSAQDVQKIIPEAVSKNDKGYLLVNNDPILWTMLNAIKEQQQQIVELRKANAKLSARLGTVEKRARKRTTPRQGRR